MILKLTPDYKISVEMLSAESSDEQKAEYRLLLAPYIRGADGEKGDTGDSGDTEFSYATTDW